MEHRHRMTLERMREHLARADSELEPPAPPDPREEPERLPVQPERAEPAEPVNPQREEPERVKPQRVEPEKVEPQSSTGGPREEGTERRSWWREFFGFGE
jgi:hypothetical protein